MRNVIIIDVSKMTRKEADKKIKEISERIKRNERGIVKHETKFEGC